MNHGHSASLFRSLVDLVRSWWSVDRIRVRPTAGRLLRLEPPCLLMIDGKTARITNRVTGTDTSGAHVRYLCDTDSGTGELLVRLTQDNQSMHATWSDCHGQRKVYDHDVTVFG